MSLLNDNSKISELEEQIFFDYLHYAWIFEEVEQTKTNATKSSSSGT